MKNKDRLPNIVLLMVDALRPDRLHCYGNPWPTSPTIDRIAREGVMFKQLIAHSSHTLPCVASIFTGLDPMSHGLTDPRTHINHSWGKWTPPLDVLEKHGMSIGGFDAFLFFHFGRHPVIEGSEQAGAFFKEHRDRPFLLWQFVDEVHLPYDPKPPYDTAFLPKGHRISEETAKRLDIVRATMIVHRTGVVSQFELNEAQGKGNKFEADADRQVNYKRSAGVVDFKPEDRIPVTALYDGEIRTLDDQIAEYVDKLEEQGVLDDTILVITSDHGEELLERGNVGHSSCSLAGSLYEEAIRVPLIIRYPRGLPSGVVVEKQVSEIDVMPTLFDMIGLAMPKEAEGRSLLPLVRNPGAAASEETYAQTLPCGWQALKDDYRQIWCVRTPQWKLIYNQYAPKEPDSWELYDLRNDPGERHNTLERNPEVVAKLKPRLLCWMKKQRTPGPGAVFPLT